MKFHSRKSLIIMNFHNLCGNSSLIHMVAKVKYKLDTISNQKAYCLAYIKIWLIIRRKHLSNKFILKIHYYQYPRMEGKKELLIPSNHNNLIYLNTNKHNKLIIAPLEDLLLIILRILRE